MTLSLEERQYRKQIVLELYKQGKTRKEIVELTGLSRAQIGKIITQLIKEGGKRDRININQSSVLEGSPRFKIIVEMSKKKASLRQIGRRLEVTGERVRQLKDKMIKNYGDNIFEPDTPLYSITEAAEQLGIYREGLRKLCRTGLVPCQLQRIKGRTYRYILDESGLNAAKQYLEAGSLRICIICDSIFKVEKGHTGKKTCSDICKGQHICDSRYTSATEDNLRGWHLELFQKLQNQSRPENEKWMVQSEAVRFTGLSHMQINYLRARQILTIRPHPSQKWRGRPVMQFSMSELEIAREVWGGRTEKTKTQNKF